MPGALLLEVPVDVELLEGVSLTGAAEGTNLLAVLDGGNEGQSRVAHEKRTSRHPLETKSNSSRPSSSARSSEQHEITGTLHKTKQAVHRLRKSPCRLRQQ